MSAHAAVEIIHRRALTEAQGHGELAERLAQNYAEQHLSAQAALELGAIDAVIEPAETRERVAAALFDGWAVEPRRSVRTMSLD